MEENKLTGIVLNINEEVLVTIHGHHLKQRNDGGSLKHGIIAGIIQKPL